MIVGASGSILTNLMADAMNRSIPSIIAGGFGGGGAVAGAAGAGEHEGTVRSTSAADAAIQLSYARQVVIVPGYGMAVAQAQHAVRELAKELEKRGVEVKYAIHPVAGRMPGHMNVLLAEADVPYDQLKEMDDINPEFPRTDVSLVIGANDVTNPAANSNPDSPIYGMPILNVNQSESVIVLKRSMNPGFAGIDNELYYDPKTQMLFGDAKASVSEITRGIDPSPDAVASYIRSLRPVTLTRDTRVTNYSFEDGKAVGFQSILQAGTAVLVDRYGEPVARCRCGNPLSKPIYYREAKCQYCPPHYNPPPPCYYKPYDGYGTTTGSTDTGTTGGYSSQKSYSNCYKFYPHPPGVRRSKAKTSTARPPPQQTQPTYTQPYNYDRQRTYTQPTYTQDTYTQHTETGCCGGGGQQTTDTSTGGEEPLGTVGQ